MQQEHNHAHKAATTQGESGFAKAPWVIALNVFILLVVAGGAAAYATMSTTVTLTVEGKTQKVRTFGSHVSDVLEARNVELKKDDRINVDPDERIDSVNEITVEFAKPVTLVVDGAATEEVVYEPTVGALLERHGVTPTKDDYLSDDHADAIPRSGLDVVVSTPKDIQVVADGQTQVINTTAPTVEEVLEEANVALDADDEASVPLDTYVAPGAAISVVRIDKETRTEEVEVPFEVQVTEDPDRAEGDNEVTQAGVAGKANETVDIVMADGQLRERVVLEREVLVEPVAQTEIHGTKKAPKTNYATGDTVWDSLAQCESGGNWAANSGNGYYGGVQFSLPTWRSMGGSGLPSEASREEQIQRASALQARSGWGQWPACARKLGLL